MSYRPVSRALALLSLMPTLALALPTSPDVQAGGAFLDRVDKATMHITCQDKTVINWDTFSVDSHEVLKFIQSADSTVLNRVTGHITGGDISRIMGTLESQGNVYILNPQGIFIGKDATINVGSLIASTLNITNADFFEACNGVKGKRGEEGLKEASVLFSGDSQAKVLNLGTIKATSGDVHVIAYEIDNQGSIEAAKGQVSLNACQEAILQPASNRRVLIKAKVGNVQEEAEHNKGKPADASLSETGVKNTGVIKALEARLGAEGSLYKLAINQSGHIEAKTFVADKGGKIFLTAEKGSIKVDGKMIAGIVTPQSVKARPNKSEKGGRIEVMADSIRLEDKADIDISGRLGGGTSLIGSDYQGKGMPFNSQHTYIGKGANVTASAWGNGNGGKIIFWGDESIEFLGNVTAKGGPNGGDGGFVEVSSPGKKPGAFKVGGLVSTLAPKGKTGTLLWDPFTITVTTDASTLSPSGNTYSGASGNIQASVLESNLSLNSIIIDAGVDGRIEIGKPTGNTGAALFTWSTNQLTLQTSGDGTVQFYKGITGSGVATPLVVNTKTLNIGLPDHSHSGHIKVDVGVINVNINEDNGSVGIYAGGTGATGGASAWLGDDSGETNTVNITDAGHIGCDLILETSSNGRVYIEGKQAVDVNLSGNIDLRVTNASAESAYAFISSDDGPVNVESTGGAITLSNGGGDNSFVEIESTSTTANGKVSVKSLGDIKLECTSASSNMSSRFYSSEGTVDVESTEGSITISCGGGNSSDAEISSFGIGADSAVSVKSSGNIKLETTNSSSNANAHIYSYDGAVDVESTGGSITLSGGGLMDRIQESKVEVVGRMVK